MRRIMFLLVAILFIGTQAFAQTTISGTVTDSNGEAVPGASVRVKGYADLGSITDLNGRYSINAPADATTLIFSFVGLQTTEVAIAGQTTINATLENEDIGINEVVVVAYGVVKREAKTGSITEFNGDDIAQAPVTSVDKLLSGKMAGVSVTASTGQPGADSDIRIRGTSSINAGSEPLWVIDGIPVMQGDQSYFTNTSNTMSAINPNDIASITVLKDAAAASVYGSRAANGVILVTTKSGAAGKAKFQVRSKFGYSSLADDNNFGVMNGQQLLEFQRTAIYNAGKDPDDPNGGYYRPRTLLEGEQTNWMDHFTRLGKMQEYEVNASGGNEKTSFYTSFNFHQNEGVFYGVDYKKYTFRVNADHQLTNTLKVGTRTNLAFTNSNDVAMQSLYYVNPAFAGMTILPWTLPYNEDGNHNIDIPENSNTNPRFSAEYDDQWEKQYRVQSSYYISWKPIEGLELKTTNAVEGTFGEGRRYWAPDYGGTEGTLQTSSLQYMQFTTSNTASYTTTFAEEHNFHLLLGQEAMKRTYHSYYIYSPGVDAQIPYPNTSTAEDDDGDYDYNARTLLSFFGIFDYNYSGKYFFQGSVRNDGSSLFGEDNKWGLFWSAAASWNITEENFMQSLSFLNLLKLRVSYGVNGNDNISAYRPYGLYTTTAYNGSTGFRPGSPSNSMLSWELNKASNIGLDVGFFKGRLTGSVDIYKRLTSDMLLDKDVPQTSGFSTNFLNIGELENKGLEIMLEGEILRTQDLVWRAGFNIAFNKTEILNLGDVEEISYSANTRLKHMVGNSLYTFYLKDYYGVNPSNGDALWYTEQGTLTNNFNEARYVEAGSPEPFSFGGFNTSLTWKGITLSAFFEFKYGNEVYIGENRYINSDGNQMSMNQKLSALDYWKKPGDTGVSPKPVAGNSSNSYSNASTRYIEDGSYTRIKDITLSYSIPSNIVKKAKLSGVNVYLSAYNLYTFHDVDFWDPERGVDGTGYGVYPMTKSIIGGIEIQF